MTAGLNVHVWRCALVQNGDQYVLGWNRNQHILEWNTEEFVLEDRHVSFFLNQNCQFWWLDAPIPHGDKGWDIPQWSWRRHRGCDIARDITGNVLPRFPVFIMHLAKALLPLLLAVKQSTSISPQKASQKGRGLRDYPRGGVVKLTKSRSTFLRKCQTRGSLVQACSLVPSPPPQLSSLVVRITRCLPQATISLVPRRFLCGRVKDWERG